MIEQKGWEEGSEREGEGDNTEGVALTNINVNNDIYK